MAARKTTEPTGKGWVHPSRTITAAGETAGGAVAGVRRNGRKPTELRTAGVVLQRDPVRLMRPRAPSPARITARREPVNGRRAGPFPTPLPCPPFGRPATKRVPPVGEVIREVPGQSGAQSRERTAADIAAAATAVARAAPILATPRPRTQLTRMRAAVRDSGCDGRIASTPNMSSDNATWLVSHRCAWLARCTGLSAFLISTD